MADQQAELSAIFGKNNILDDTETLDSYSRDESFAPQMMPRFVVKPANVDEVQKVVRWANSTKTPLVPVSSGPPHFRGDTVPSAPGAVIVDLSGMKKILTISRRNRIAVIEPGVTYSELQPALAKQGLRLSTTLLPRANKSVIASLLEREPRLNARFQWSSMEPLRSTEIIWGDGNRLWSGSPGHGVMDLQKQISHQQWPMDPAGPGQTDFYRFLAAAQGSIGIVTWASIRLEVLPQIHKLYFVPAKKLDDLLDFTYRILKLRYADELFIVNNVTLASILGKDPGQISKFKDSLPQWTTIVGIAGRTELPEERVEFQEKDIQEIAAQFGVQLLPEIGGVAGASALQTILNPSSEPYWKLRYKGACQDIFFITTLDRAPAFAQTMSSAAAKAGYPVMDIGVYLQPRHQGVNCHCEFNIPYNPKTKRDTIRVEKLFSDASAKLFTEGAFYTRPYGIWADMAFSKDEPSTRLLKNIKATFDPNNIMNPCKLCF